MKEYVHRLQATGQVLSRHRRSFAWAGIVAGVLLVAWLGIRVPIERLELRALPDLSFTDLDKGGRSVLSFGKEPGEAVMAWELRPGTAYPYCGALWRLRSGDSLRDLSRFDGIEVSWRSSRGLPVRWTLETVGPEARLPGMVHRMRLVQSETRPPLRWARETIPGSAFLVPLWWFQANRRMADSLRCLGRVSHLTFSSGESAPHGVPDTVRLRSLALLQRGRRKPAFLLLLAPLGVLAWRLRCRRRDEPERALPAALPRPLEIPPTAAQKVVAFLAGNYARAELDLAQTARETGLSEAAVSAGVKEATGEGFRQHLGRLRLTEAARLVRTSRLQMTEIAFRVGYGNVSHFNRQFREQWGCSPSEMRQGELSGTDSAPS